MRAARAPTPCPAAPAGPNPRAELRRSLLQALGSAAVGSLAGLVGGVLVSAAAVLLPAALSACVAEAPPRAKLPQPPAASPLSPPHASPEPASRALPPLLAGDDEPCDPRTRRCR